MSDFKARLISELSELNKKVDKLNSFLNNDKFLELPLVQQELLGMQLLVMTNYSVILSMRLRLLK